MKRLTTALLTCTLAFGIAQAQPTDALTLSRKEAESIFLQQNLELLSSRLEIDQAQALLIQSKLWPNPTFSLSDVNLWANSSAEEFAPLIGPWGKTSQFALGIEQIVQTAGKRKKNIALHELEIQSRTHAFESVLRSLKMEFRNALTELQFYQEQRTLYLNQIQATAQLIQAYKNQLNAGNISRAEYIRLKAAEMEFRKDLQQVEIALEETQKELKNWMNTPAETILFISDSLVEPLAIVDQRDLKTWIEEAEVLRPDAWVAKNAEQQAIQKHQLEKAQRIPDLHFSINYDRAGGTMPNFVGVGLALDLPIFDNNRGNIKEAALEIDKSKNELRAKKSAMQNEITQAFNNYQKALSLNQTIEGDYETHLDELLAAYHKNFSGRNTSLIEYLDFVSAYLENKNIILENKKELLQQYEKLQYAIGKELIIK